MGHFHVPRCPTRYDSRGHWRQYSILTPPGFVFGHRHAASVVSDYPLAPILLNRTSCGRIVEGSVWDTVKETCWPHVSEFGSQMGADGGRCVTFRKICKSGRLWHDRNVEAISSFGVRRPYRPGVTSGTTGQALRQIERQRCPEMGPAGRRFSLEPCACCRVLPCCA